ncbi:hypothetical protein NQZ68_007931 [Dissostichus eleginoides]|nr:hypothetical protein NQZ68_007931 [Dissostichus eleginoides]
METPHGGSRCFAFVYAQLIKNNKQCHPGVGAIWETADSSFSCPMAFVSSPMCTSHPSPDPCHSQNKGQSVVHQWADSAAGSTERALLIPAKARCREDNSKSTTMPEVLPGQAITLKRGQPNLPLRDPAAERARELTPNTASIS